MTLSSRRLKTVLSAVALGALLLQSSIVSAKPDKKEEEKHPGMTALAQQAAGGDAERTQRFIEILQKATYQQSIIDAISRPAEAKPWKDYRPIFMTQERIDGGVKFWQDHEALLAATEKRYGVPTEYVVAIIGVETFYGRHIGKYKVLDALTTLGLYYPPRQPFFSGELKQFLQFSEDQKYRIDLDRSVGSYAGAMGLGQFMPSSWKNFAVDGDADGGIDLWTSKPDIFASISNYFIGHGWEVGGPVVRAASLTATAKPISNAPLLPGYTVSELKRSGYQVRGKLKGKRKATTLALEGPQGTEHYMAFQNFYVITRYNRSPLYAMAVHQLAQSLAKAKAAK